MAVRFSPRRKKHLGRPAQPSGTNDGSEWSLHPRIFDLTVMEETDGHHACHKLTQEVSDLHLASTQSHDLDEGRISTP